MAKLIVNPTSPMRRELSLPRSLLSIGRDPSNDLVLADAMVSRRHAVIELRGHQYFLRDCSSSNGSLVNGDRVSERGLRDGDLVAIGTARLLFREDLEALDPAGKVVLHPSAPRLHCAQCGADYRRGDLFCKACGASVQLAQPRTVCTACGSAVVQPARFCSACGASLAPAETRTEDTPAEPGAGREVTALAPRPELPSGSHLVTSAGPRRIGAVVAASEAQPAAAALHTARAEQVAPSVSPVQVEPAVSPEQIEPAVPAAQAEPASPDANVAPAAFDAHLASPAAASPTAAAEAAPQLDIPSDELESLPGWTVRAPASVPAASGGAVAAGAERALPPPHSRPQQSHPPRSRPSPGRAAALTKDQAWSPTARALRDEPRASRGQAPQQPAADLGARLLAGALDFLAVGLVQVLLLLPAGSYWWSRDLTGPTPVAPVALTAALLLLTLALGTLYFIYLWGVWGATPGKRLVGLAVEGLDGSYPIGLPRATVRFLGYLLSIALLGGGFLLIVLDGSGLHDRLAATRVVRRRS